MTETANLLRETAMRLFEGALTPNLRRDAAAGNWPEAVWSDIDASGLARPFGHGGDMSWRDLFGVIWASGYHAAPVPLAETIAADFLLARADLAAPPGPLAGADVSFSRAIRRDEGCVVSAEIAMVPWARRLAGVVAEATFDGAAYLIFLPNGAYQTEEGSNLAGEARDRIRFDRTFAPTAPLPHPGMVRDVCAAVRAAQISGALDWLVEHSARYANERTQFGRPIGKFQAIQHQLAVLACEAAAARVAATAAFAALDRGEAGFEVAVAKLRASEAAGRGAAIAHQVHGAIGFTDEHALHHRTQRLWSWRSENGNEAFWAERLGAVAFDAGADGLWPLLTARHR
ncbi:MAG: acyl-CoA dehydrogenase family protein [Alphaproteobacteria bacterium]